MQSILSFNIFPNRYRFQENWTKTYIHICVQQICMLMLCVLYFCWHQRIFRIDFVVPVIDMGMIILSKSILLIITFVSDASSMMRKYDCQKNTEIKSDRAETIICPLISNSVTTCSESCFIFIFPAKYHSCFFLLFYKTSYRAHACIFPLFFGWLCSFFSCARLIEFVFFPESDLLQTSKPYFNISA